MRTRCKLSQQYQWQKHQNKRHPNKLSPRRTNSQHKKPSLLSFNVCSRCQ